MARPKNVSNLFMPFTSKGRLPPEKERIRFQLAKTITVEGSLKVKKTDKNHWMIGDHKFRLTPGNQWVRDRLIQFRNQGINVVCWIRDDGVLLSVKTSRW